jgi:hypothetical protein
MAIATRKPEKGDGSDFDPSELLAAHGEHDKNISNLTERMAKVEGHLATPQALAAFMKESTKDSRMLDGVFADMFCRFMKENPDVQEVVRSKLEEIDRIFFFKTLKRAWFWIYTVIVAMAAIVGKEVVDWMISLIPHK